MKIVFTVSGQPKGQPRARAFAFKGKARLFTPGTAEAWKGEVAHAALPHIPPEPTTDPVRVYLGFRFDRPNKHFTKKGLRPDAPVYHVSKPDADNLAKAVMDCLSVLRVWKDDAQVAQLDVTKCYGVPGCDVEIRTLEVTK